MAEHRKLQFIICESQRWPQVAMAAWSDNDNNNLFVVHDPETYCVCVLFGTGNGITVAFTFAVLVHAISGDAQRPPRTCCWRLSCTLIHCPAEDLLIRL